MKKIQILGTGCPKCRQLLANAEAAVQAAGIEASVEKVDRIAEIMKFGVMVTPALAVDGKVRSAGKVLSADAIRKLLLALLVAATLGPAGVRAETNAPAVAPSNTVAAATVRLPRLVDLGADKCVPCKLMAPILKDLGKAFSNELEVVFIDVWKNPKAGETYGIRMIPTQIFYDAAGKELFRHEGFYAREEILKKWKELGVELAP